MNDLVLLVDKNDNPIGVGDKLLTHVQGRLHRALSVIIYNSKGEMLLQQRAFTKYHSAGLWTNACCSHPAPDEKPIDAAHRRLMEEMGMSCELYLADKFIYYSELDDELSEHELDYVFVGYSDDIPLPNPAEVASYRYVSLEDLSVEISKHPQRFTSWFNIMCEKNIIRFVNDGLKPVL